VDNTKGMSFQRLQQQLEAAGAEVMALREEAAQRLQQLAGAQQETADLKQEVHPDAHRCHACCLADTGCTTSIAQLPLLSFVACLQWPTCVVCPKPMRWVSAAALSSGE
jgi:hypothetical protein